MDTNYEVLNDNGDNTALVQLTIGDNVLNVNVDLGQSIDDFATNVSVALQSFQNDLSLLPVAENTDSYDISPLLNQPQVVTNIKAVPAPSLTVVATPVSPAQPAQLGS